MSAFVKNLLKELDIVQIGREKDKSYIVAITSDVNVKIWDLEPGFSFHGNLTLCPADNREDLFIYLMKANLLGSGTGSCKIGLDQEEKFLTISYNMEYKAEYIEFKENLEDFVNYLIYWREEIEKYIKQSKQAIL